MITNFGGPVFTESNTLGPFVIIIIAAIPIIAAFAGMALIIRDIIQKKRRKSTLVFLGVAAVIIFLVQVIFAGAI